MKQRRTSGKSKEVPRDKFNVVLLSTYILGIASLLPWNFFITANDYWMYKFRNLSSTEDDFEESKTPLQISFTSYLSISSAVPMVLAHAFNTFTSRRISLKFRLGGALFVAFLMAVLTAVLTQVDTSGDQKLFFIVTMCTAVLINGTGAIIQGSSTGLAGCLPEVYMKSTIYGMATAGIFAACAQIASLSDPHPTDSALGYFICAALTLLLAMGAFAVIQKMKFYQYHMSTQIDKVKTSETSDGDESLASIFIQIWPYALSVFLVFTITLAVFPGVVVLTVSLNPSLSIWTNRLFLPVCCFLLFNLSDLSGRLVGGWLTLPYKQRLVIFLMLLLHSSHIPLLMMCNSHPRKYLPVLFESDAYFVFFMCTLGLMTGYICNVSYIKGPKCVNEGHQQTAGTMMGAFQGVGLMAGAVASYFLVHLL